MSLGWGIIGAGGHAERSMGSALTLAANTKLVAVCDCNVERAKSFAVKYGVKQSYDSLGKMLEDPELDVLYIATPNSLHAQQTIEAAEAGKHVLCEKPMALTEADCERMIETCNKNKVKLAINFQNRYHPAHVEAHRLIRAGEVGEIMVAKAQYCRGFGHGHWQGWRIDPSMAGAGALMATALHPIDLLRFLLDSEVEEVQALCEPQAPYRTVDEMVYVILKFTNGVHGMVLSGILVPRSDDDAVLYGTKAKISCKGTIGVPLRGELVVKGDSIDMTMASPTDNPMSANYIRLVEAFNRSIEENAELDISGHNGMQMVKIANAILQSSHQRKAVTISKKNKDENV